MNQLCKSILAAIAIMTLLGSASLEAKAMAPASAAELTITPKAFGQSMQYAETPDKSQTELVPDHTLDISKTPSGLVCIITKHGTGRQPKPGEIVLLRATAILESGKQFRKPNGGNESDWFWLLPDKQPKGVIEGMSLLHVGDSAILVVPPALGYGSEGGRGGAVPPNAVLTYFVDILGVKSDDLASMLLDSIEANGIDEALRQYEELKGRGFPDIHVDEENMNSLGYHLLNTGDRLAAIKIFKLNVDAYPQSANACDSLGEAYAANGDKQLAVQTYQKALALDPKLKSSAKALKELQSN